jgi:hypothetical protein
MPARHHPAIGVALVALLLAGCGSSSHKATPTTSTAASSTSPTTATAINKSAFLERAKAICDSSNTQIAAAAHQAFAGQQPAESQWRSFMVASVLPLVKARLTSIRALGSPQGETANTKAMVDAGLTAIQTAKAHPQLLSQNSRAPFDSFDDAVTAYGLPDCAVGG